MTRIKIYRGHQDCHVTIQHWSNRERARARVRARLFPDTNQEKDGHARGHGHVHDKSVQSRCIVIPMAVPSQQTFLT